MIKIQCGCGSKQGLHELGNEKCFREIVPKGWQEPKKVNKGWSIPSNQNGARVTITEFTLNQQRGHKLDKDAQRWHRPKERGDDWFESKGWN